MSTQTTPQGRALFDAIDKSDSKMDGFAAILSANTVAFTNVISQLTSLREAPIPEEIDHIIRNLKGHMQDSELCVQRIATVAKPLVPTNGELPMPNPMILGLGRNGGVGPLAR